MVKGEKAEVIANAQGNHSTPSIVAFSDKEILVGEVAVGQAAKNSSNTIVECKRLLGRKPGDETVGKDSKRWSFSIVPKDGKAGVQVGVSVDRPLLEMCIKSDLSNQTCAVYIGRYLIILS